MEKYYVQPRLYPPVTDIVEALITFFYDRHRHSEKFFVIKVSRKAQILIIFLQV